MIRAADTSHKIRDQVEAVFRHKKKLVVYNLLVVVGVIAALLFWPRTYISEAKVWIKIGRENTKLDPTAATGERISMQEADREDEIISVIDVLQSRGVVTGAVEQLGPKVVLGDEPLPGSEPGRRSSPVTTAIKSVVGRAVKVVKQIDPVSEKEEAIQEILKNLEVTAERKSNVISIAYDTDSPALAQAVVTSLIDVYKAEHSRIHHTAGSHQFFSEQRDALREKVENASEELRSAKDRIGLASIDGQRQILESEMLNVASSKLDTVRRAAEAEARMSELKRLLDVHPERIQSEQRSVPNTGRDNLEAQLYSLQVRRMELEAKFDDAHPLLKAVKQQEEDARREVALETSDRSEVTESLNKVHEALSLEFAQVEASAAGFQATLDTLQEQEQLVVDRIASLNRAEIELKRLERELRLAESNYVTYSENLEDARVDQALNENAISNVSVAQPATYEEKPASPSKLLIAVLGVGAMLCGSVAIVAGAQMTDTTLQSPQDVEALLDVPVVVSVPSGARYSHVLR